MAIPATIRRTLRTNDHARALKETFAQLSRIRFTKTKTLSRLLQDYGIETVIDVGANVGQFGLDLRRLKYEKRIISFEPVESIFKNLEINARRSGNWDVYKLALGSSTKEAKIYISGNDGLSSSLLRMNDIHLMNFPESQTIGDEIVSVTTLNDLIPKLGIDPETTLLKIDSQGAEFEILNGAGKYLKDIAFCLFESSLYEFYEGEATLPEVLRLLSSHGHRLIDAFDALRSEEGELLQMDILTKSANVV